MRKRLIVCAVAALVLAAPAAAADRPNPVLDAISTEVAGKPIHAWCETSEAQWIAWELQFNVVLNGFTYLSQPVTYIGPRWCFALQVALASGYRDAGVAHLAQAVNVLVHEAVHQRGITNECQTEKTAQTLVMGVAERYFGVTPTVPEFQNHAVSYTTTVRRKIAGKWRTIKVRSQRVVTQTVQVPNVDYSRFQMWATAWHNAMPPEYLGC